MPNYDMCIKCSVLFWTPLLKGCQTWKDQLPECSTCEVGAGNSAGVYEDSCWSEKTVKNMMCLWYYQSLKGNECEPESGGMRK